MRKSRKFRDEEGREDVRGCESNGKTVEDESSFLHHSQKVWGLPLVRHDGDQYDGDHY